MSKIASFQPSLTKTAAPAAQTASAASASPAAQTAQKAGATDRFEAGGSSSSALPPPGADPATDGKFARAGDLLSAMRAGADPLKAVDVLGADIGKGAIDAGQLPGAPTGDDAGLPGLPGLPGTEGSEAANGTGPSGGADKDSLLRGDLATGMPGMGSDSAGTDGPGFPGVGAQTGPQRGSAASGLMMGGGGGTGPENWHVETSSSDVSGSDGSQSARQETHGTNLDTGESISDVSTHERDAEGNVTETQEVTTRDAEGNVTAHEKTTTKTDADGNTTTTTESNTGGQNEGNDSSGNTEGGNEGADQAGDKKNDVGHSLEPGSEVPRPSMDTVRKMFGDGTGPDGSTINPNPDAEAAPAMSEAQMQAELQRKRNGLVNPVEAGSTNQADRAVPRERDYSPVINPGN